jgi:Rrf2 family protein
MKISTRGRYALDFMVNIISDEERKPTSLKEAARRQGVSDKYLEQLVVPLVKHGFVVSVRGMNGGYFLKRKPEEYTVGEILRIMEGDLAPVPCVEANASFCEKRAQCSKVRLWEEINSAINSVVDNITLADMYKWKMEKQESLLIQDRN